ncbi:histidine-rich glycoprotein-like [Apus apus]|uniref:histidine-rich glycoprotein-like n=1 Tax=Apus apus TaxID=8895 RepID=UPI0021F87DCE|nr:histidine-rich glycoprotein-like [Apus apus]XP_051482118.1 histidine-rich glycoprotein-like [Apus apus]XP_051482119.1 histidine-rich glycoprotein-like [Apus apus]XP_051482120.1 histidine-rich glycoprotein-like [Apus apus]XP_051482121.1 histidine-rich glycoprotein-like [Apus apus]XP_051482122.1 histidine-rich glycoprotein-like [Apus apus]XP_051482123.1 histidine-rich glycoprotein-like [Apus apus]XP_051482124.1 histidine-rich glycoprotein-like [Apus apus]
MEIFSSGKTTQTFPSPSSFGHRHCYRHHHKHRHRHGRPFRLEDAEHNHSFNEEHHDNHEGPAPPSSPHGGPHHHLHLPHYCPTFPPHDGSHPLPQEESQPPPSAPPPHDVTHHPTPSQEEVYDLPSLPPPHNKPHNAPPRPHHRPHCPLPPHGPHHHHSFHHELHCPFPPHELHHHHPPPHHGPHHPSHVCRHYYRHHCNKTSTSGKYFPFQTTGAVCRNPVLNQQDPLTPPTANFPELFQRNSHSSMNGEGILFTGSSLKEMLETLGFPDHSTQLKSCPGNSKFLLPKILPILPHLILTKIKIPK